MLQKIQETAEFLRGKITTAPETAIILGTGLGSLVNEITDKYEIEYKDIPNFPLSTVEGHSGKLIFGKLGNKEIMAKNIRKYLELNDMTQTDLCNALGLKFMTVSDWVNAKSYPRIDKIEMMANYFGISKADLVEEHTDKEEYYIDPKTAQIAQEIKDSKELTALFDVQREMSPEDLQTVYQLALALKRKEG